MSCRKQFWTPDAYFNAKISVIQSRRVLQASRKMGRQQGKELWPEELMAQEDAELQVFDKREVARMHAEDEAKAKAKETAAVVSDCQVEAVASPQGTL